MVIIYTILVIFIVAFITFYYTMQTVCIASVTSLNPHSLPIPTYEYIPSAGQSALPN